MKAIGRALPALARDAAGISGAGLIVYGAWLVYAPAGFVVGGTFLMLSALVLARRAA